jgi:hypothetical protein
MGENGSRAQIDFSKPTSIIMGMVLLVAAGSAGSMFGITIEPEETTLLRVEAARMEVKIVGLEERLALLEQVVDGCQRLIATCRTRAEEE